MKKVLVFEGIIVGLFLYLNFLVISKLLILQGITVYNKLVYESSGMWLVLNKNNDTIRSDIPAILLFPDKTFESPQNEIWIKFSSSSDLQTGDFDKYSVYKVPNDANSAYYLNIENIRKKKKLKVEITDVFENKVTKDIIIEHNDEYKWLWDIYSEEIVPEGDDLDTIVDKVRALPYDYIPEDIVAISDYEIPATINGIQLREIVIKNLKKLILSAEEEGIELFIVSGFRPFVNQYYLYANNVYYFGFNETDKKVARPGHSEHQLGTAIDITSSETLNREVVAFEDTKASKWLEKNAYKHGFVLTYPDKSIEKTGYIYEPWHYRYVGKDLSRKVVQSGMTLEEYLKQNNSTIYE